MKQTFKLSFLLLLIAPLFFITSCEENAQSSCNDFAVTIDYNTIDSTSVDLTAVTVGGEPDFTFAWNTGASTASINVTEFDTYSVTVTDGNACTASVDFVIDSLPNYGDLCDGFSAVVIDTVIDGSAYIETLAWGGEAPYTYNWSTGGTEYFTQLTTAGTYNVTVTDANGCEVVAGYIYNGGNNCPFQVSFVEGIDSMSMNETITASVGGGVAPYTYAWMNGEVTETIDIIPGISTYTVTITDNDGCVVTAIYEVPVSGPCDNFSATIISMPDSNSVFVTLAVDLIGGTAPYEYLWSQGDITPVIAVQIMSGSYSVTVEDANGCTDEDTIQL